MYRAIELEAFNHIFAFGIIRRNAPQIIAIEYIIVISCFRIIKEQVFYFGRI